MSGKEKIEEKNLAKGKEHFHIWILHYSTVLYIYIYTFIISHHTSYSDLYIYIYIWYI